MGVRSWVRAESVGSRITHPTPPSTHAPSQPSSWSHTRRSRHRSLEAVDDGGCWLALAGADADAEAPPLRPIVGVAMAACRPPRSLAPASCDAWDHGMCLVKGIGRSERSKHIQAPAQQPAKPGTI